MLVERLNINLIPLPAPQSQEVYGRKYPNVNISIFVSVSKAHGSIPWYLFHSNTDTWIGLKKTGGSWGFTDGSMFDFEPPGSLFNENHLCARIKPWVDDRDCDAQFDYVCSVPVAEGKKIIVLPPLRKLMVICSEGRFSIPFILPLDCPISFGIFGLFYFMFSQRFKGKLY